MAREIMRRKAADNEYLHRDFHAGLSLGLDFLRRRYGADSVREYLRDFARAYYAPLTAALNKRGLAAMRDHLRRLYRIEKGRVRFRLRRDELEVEVAACPAVTHMRKNGFPVSPLFAETHRALYDAICEGTPFAFELVRYDRKTGRSLQRFYRREP